MQTKPPTIELPSVQRLFIESFEAVAMPALAAVRSTVMEASRVNIVGDALDEMKALADREMEALYEQAMRDEAQMAS